jgi:hypothetical protein
VEIKKRKRNGLSERIGNSTHATQNPTPIYLTSHFFVLKANSEQYLGVLYSSNPTPFSFSLSFSLAVSQTSAVLNSRHNTKRLASWFLKPSCVLLSYASALLLLVPQEAKKKQQQQQQQQQ